MPRIDHFSKALGSLEAKLDSHDETHTLILGGIKDIRDQITLMNGSVKASHMRIDYMEPQLDEAIKNGEDWIRTRAGAKWLFAGMTIASSSIGAAVTGFAGKIFGEGG